MSYREFDDDEGRSWEVWEVHPTLTERRLVRDRRRIPRDGAERRLVQMRRRTLPRALQEGWLAFQHGQERRRYFPIPDEWEELTDGELASLAEQAQINRRARRLV